MTSLTQFALPLAAPIAPSQICACPVSNDAELMRAADLRKFGYQVAVMRGLAAFFREVRA